MLHREGKKRRYRRPGRSPQNGLRQSTVRPHLLSFLSPSNPSLVDGEPIHRPLSPPLPAMPTKLREALGDKDEKLPWLWQRDVFPFGIDVSHGAVVVGNDATPTVTIAEFGTAEGVVRTEEVSFPFSGFVRWS